MGLLILADGIFLDSRIRLCLCLHLKGTQPKKSPHQKYISSLKEPYEQIKFRGAINLQGYQKKETKQNY